MILLAGTGLPFLGYGQIANAFSERWGGFPILQMADPFAKKII